MSTEMPLNDAETIAMVDELVGRAELAMMKTLNIAANKIYEGSQREVPKGPPEQHTERAGLHMDYPRETLEASGRVLEATVEDHTAQVVYDSPYATAQEVGRMSYESKTGKRVEWEAEHYTTPGTKARYLEDPGKSVLGLVPEELAVQGRIAFGEVPGLTVPRSELQSMGRRSSMTPAPTGEVATFMNEEQVKTANVTFLEKAPSGSVLRD